MCLRQKKSADAKIKVVSVVNKLSLLSGKVRAQLMKLTLTPTCRRAGRGQLLLSCDADHPGHLVEVEALAALDRPLVVVVFPWGQHE